MLGVVVKVLLSSSAGLFVIKRNKIFKLVPSITLL